MWPKKLKSISNTLDLILKNKLEKMKEKISCVSAKFSVSKFLRIKFLLKFNIGLQKFS